MGHRANFVVIRDNHAVAYYDQWAALGCIYTFAAGPAEAVDALTEMDQTTELMDWAYAEGGYLLDFDNQVAIGFGSPFYDDEIDEGEPDENNGGSSVTPDPINVAYEQGPLEFLKCIAPAWEGWKLVWDDHGVDAFAAHLRDCNITDISVARDSHPANTAAPVTFQA